jgi:hypothetical protein
MRVNGRTPADTLELLVRGALVVSGAAILALAGFGVADRVGRLSSDSLGATHDIYRFALACLIGGVLVGLGVGSAPHTGRVGAMRLAAAAVVAGIFVPSLADTVPLASVGGPTLGLAALLAAGARVAATTPCSAEIPKSIPQSGRSAAEPVDGGQADDVPTEDRPLHDR